VLAHSEAELLEAAVTTASGHTAQQEPLRVPAPPLDVLCQQLLGMSAQRPWDVAEAYGLVRRAYPYRDLPWSEYRACLDYLSGRRRDGAAWLPARIRWDGDEFSITDGRTARLLWRNLGTIISDEPWPVLLRNSDCRAASSEWGGPELIAVGQVDEGFADRLQPGDRFLLDGRCLELRRCDGRSLVVDEVAGNPLVPRWPGSGWPLSAELARRVYLLRTQAAEALREGTDALGQLLEQEYGLVGTAAEILARLFQRQECLSEIPEAGGWLVEEVPGGGGADYYLHTPLNRSANDALARVAVRRLNRETGRPVRSIAADLGFVLSSPTLVLTPDRLRRLLTSEHFVADLDAAVADSAALRERFHAAALTGLMLLRNPLGRKRRVGGHDWPERRLFEQVSAADPGFVLLRQARREVLDELLDAVAAREFAGVAVGRGLDAVG
jgi:ATP-dependent Lhr-like helicase